MGPAEATLALQRSSKFAVNQGRDAPESGHPLHGNRCPLWAGEFNRSTQHYTPKLSGVGLKQFLH
jgi:hypothetical protein